MLGGPLGGGARFSAATAGAVPPATPPSADAGWTLLLSLVFAVATSFCLRFSRRFSARRFSTTCDTETCQKVRVTQEKFWAGFGHLRRCSCLPLNSSRASSVPPVTRFFRSHAHVSVAPHPTSQNAHLSLTQCRTQNRTGCCHTNTNTLRERLQL